MINHRFLRRAGALVLAWSWFAVASAQLDEQTRIQVEALNRLKGIDLEANPALKNAVLNVIEKTRGTALFVGLVRDFKLDGHEEALLEFALRHPAESAGVEAFRLAAPALEPALLSGLLSGTNAPSAAQLIGNAASREHYPLLRGLLLEELAPLPLRKEAVRALAKTEDGAGQILSLAREDQLPPALRLDASFELNRVSWPEIRARAAQLLPLPQGQDAEPLPPISELVRRTGDPARGRAIYFSETSACASCHQVNGQGIDFGPALSEIGTKLGKDALYESVLDPSSGISFGYEAWTLELNNGDEAYGIMVSETEDEVALKTQSGITTRYKISDIQQKRKMTSSIMPAGLQATMSTQDLVDLVEYLSTLRKPEE